MQIESQKKRMIKYNIWEMKKKERKNQRKKGWK